MSIFEGVKNLTMSMCLSLLGKCRIEVLDIQFVYGWNSFLFESVILIAFRVTSFVKPYNSKV